MATLGAIKTRIITEMVRDDLSDDLADQLATHIERACEYYAGRKFWFNTIVTTTTTTSGNAVVSVPSTVRRIDRVSIPALNININEVTLAELPIFEVSGIPTVYAYDGDTLRLYPTPDSTFTLRITGIANATFPASDDDSNIWTNEGQDLIVAHTRMTLYRDQFRDAEGVQMAMGAASDALKRLTHDTAKRLETPLRAEGFDRPFNILTG